jgi:uncharacterized protein (DUF4213/DUF364 family)
MQILSNILADIKGLKDISQLRIDDLHVCSPFAAVQLSDGSIGSAGNYAVQNHTAGYQPARIREEYLESIEKDPLLLDTLCDDRSLVGLSVQVAILSALSQSLLNATVLRAFALSCKPVVAQREAIAGVLKSGDSVSLIGFGGGLDALCTSDRVDHLYVCDFMFQQHEYREIAWRRIKRLGGDQSRVTLVDGVCSGEVVALSDICFITGSALCNGTMEALLSQARKCREVVIQGPSCSLWPMEFFRCSVTLVLTTRKTVAEFEAGKLPGDGIYNFSDLSYLAISPTGKHHRTAN